MCCAWIAEGLIKAGYLPGNRNTEELVQRWSGAPADGFLGSKSVEYIRRSDHLRDLEYVLSHIDDSPAVFTLKDQEIVMIPVAQCHREKACPISTQRKHGRLPATCVFPIPLFPSSCSKPK